MAEKEPVIVIHGGAWAIPDYLSEASVEGVKRAAKCGFEILLKGGSAVDAVESAVILLENDPAFDAGHGSVLNSKGEIEMDSIIMDGNTLNNGAVACVKNIANPVQLARLVMDKTPHCLLVGQGANDFAAEQGVRQVPTEELITDEARKEFERYMLYRPVVEGNFSLRENRQSDSSLGHDTVGAVALDKHGNVAFATSTGGITAKRVGRVGDSPIIGSGGYADNESGAVSTTGHGESILKVCLAHSITSAVKQGTPIQTACENSLEHMADRVSGSGGVVAVSALSGEVGIAFTTQRMAWACIDKGKLRCGLNPGENNVENGL